MIVLIFQRCRWGYWSVEPGYLGAGLRVDELAAEAIVEFLRVRALGEVEHEHVDVSVAERVAAPGERQPFALVEEVERQVLVVCAPVRGQRHLVRVCSCLLHDSGPVTCGAQSNCERRSCTGISG